jgi:hypothetical protein
MGLLSRALGALTHDLGGNRLGLARLHGGLETGRQEWCAILRANKRYQGFRRIFLQLRIVTKTSHKCIFNNAKAAHAWPSPAMSERPQIAAASR